MPRAKHHRTSRAIKNVRNQKPQKPQSPHKHRQPLHNRKGAATTPKKAVLSEADEATKTLTFTPYAWAKLLFLCHRGETEVAAMGLTAEDDPLRIEDLAVPKQSASSFTVELDDDAVADLFDEQVDAGRSPERFFRIWLHTHPGDSPQPSGTDEATFDRVFGRCHWAVMFILARGGDTYARLQFNLGPGGAIDLPVRVDHFAPFPGSDHAAWESLYDERITHEADEVIPWPSSGSRMPLDEDDADARVLDAIAAAAIDFGLEADADTTGDDTLWRQELRSLGLDPDAFEPGGFDVDVDERAAIEADDEDQDS